MVTLASWRKERGLTVPALAKELGVSKGAAMKYLSGERPPQREIALRIVRLTGGQVTAVDLWGEDFWLLLGPTTPDAAAPGPAPGGNPVEPDEEQVAP